MNEQQIFDAVVAHAREQKVLCVDEKGTCRYRGPHGLKCFIGAVIPDELYDPEYEGHSIAHLLHRGAIGVPPAKLDRIFAYVSIDYLMGLQKIHDTTWRAENLRGNNCLGTWEIELARFARDYGGAPHTPHGSKLNVY